MEHAKSILIFSDDTSIVHEEILKLFIILLSTELTQPMGSPVNVFFDILLEPPPGEVLEFVYR
jgi:hypothetical protein